MDIFGILTAGGFLVAIVPYCVQGYRFVTRARRMRRFWDGDSKDYILVYPVHKDPTSSSGEFRLVKHETVSATRRVEEFLKSHGCRVTLKRAIDSFTEDEKGLNVVLIGSSRNNHVVKRLFPELEESFEFGSDDGRYFVLDKTNQVCLASPLDKGIEADFALIGKMPNRYSKASCNRVYYVAGIHAIGCWAGAEFLTDYSKLKSLPKCARDRRLFFIIQAKFAGFCGMINTTVNFNNNNDNFGPGNTGTGLPRQIQFSLRLKF